jgi:septum formation protein
VADRPARVPSLTVVLASGSPRRRELLERVGVAVEVDPADIDESVHPGEAAGTYVARLSAAKAAAVAIRHPGRTVVAGDTAVVVDGEVLGQALDGEGALAMLRRLAGRTHEVLTAVTVAPAGAPPETFVERADVTMAPVGEEELLRYVASGEPIGKAGGYAVQGIGAALVTRLVGDPTTVIGLPLRPTLERLRAGAQNLSGS